MKRLLLVGGGHSHLEVLRRLSGMAAAGFETHLLAPERYAIYSGMIPGVIAGDYGLDECRIDLAALAHRAGVRFDRNSALGLDVGRRLVLTAEGSGIEYDVVSLDVGSALVGADVHGVAGHAIQVRPASAFLDRLQHLIEGATAKAPLRIAVVGAGAAGVEIALTIAFRLRRGNAPHAGVVIVSESPEVLPALDSHARAAAGTVSRSRNVDLDLCSKVVRVDAEGILLADGHGVAANVVIWATGAAAPSWLAATALETDSSGFVSVNEFLQSVSHPEVFAAGDCATHLRNPFPKSGVVAVRQGPVLAENLTRALRGKKLLEFRSSANALAILNCGGREAIASWRGQSFHGRWVWHWKDWLDRRFVARYA